MLQVATSPCAVISLSGRSSNRFPSEHTPLVKCWPGSQQMSNTAVRLSDPCCSPVQAAASDLLAFAPKLSTATGGLHKKHERSQGCRVNPPHFLCRQSLITAGHALRTHDCFLASRRAKSSLGLAGALLFPSALFRGSRGQGGRAMVPCIGFWYRSCPGVPSARQGQLPSFLCVYDDAAGACSQAARAFKAGRFLPASFNACDAFLLALLRCV